MKNEIIRGVASSLSLTALALALAACASDQSSQPPSSLGERSPQSPFPGTEWTHADPATLGFSQSELDKAIKYAKHSGSTSGMIVQHGLVVAEWGDVARKSNLHSARKSFMSALIGIAVARGQINLDDTLAQLGIDDAAPSLSETEKQATVRMLLEARSGVYHPTVYETTGMADSKPPRYSHDPGTFWYYNNWDFNTVGAIYEKATGQHIFDAIKTQIAEPIGVQDYRPSDGTYVSGWPETRFPAYPFNLSARDFARFALLYLHDGRWRDTQVVPAEWVTESTRSYSNTKVGGYGYMWWNSIPADGPRTPAMALLRPAFWAEGHLGQYAIVVPSLDLVVVNMVDSTETPRHSERSTMGQTKMEKFVWMIERADGATDIGPEPGHQDDL